MNYRETKELYSQTLYAAEKNNCVVPVMRDLGRSDLFFLLVYILNRKDADREWIFDRCREVQANPDGFLDLWAREHYKSTIITFALTIQDIINNPEETFGILSFNRPIAKAFLRQIKIELEQNKLLVTLYPEVFFENPKTEAPKWSENEGITVRRKGNPKEATIEAYGLTDGQPTSKHWGTIIYEDIVTRDSVRTPEAIKNTTDAWKLSSNLGKDGGRKRYVGTIYHFNDTYKTVIDNHAAKPRIYPATKDGTESGEPVLVSKEYLSQKRREQGPYVFSCQMLLNPVEDSKQGFKEEWLRYWNATNYNNLNIYILCDPAGEKKKENDYTVFWVVGLGPDRNFYPIKVVRDRLSLTERGNMLFKLHQDYNPVGVGYEKYGKDSDIEHYEFLMQLKNYRFHIQELGGTQLSKNDRISKLIPIFEQGRMFLPETCIHKDYQGITSDLIQAFINDEYKCFPYPVHDDMLDSLARILDPKLAATFPEGKEHTGLMQDYTENNQSEEEYDPLTWRR